MKLAPKVVAPLFVLIGGAGGTVLLSRARSEPEQVELERVVPAVSIVVAEPEAHRYRVEAHGTVLPRTQSEVVAEVEGRVIEVSERLVSGGFFDAGELLLRLDAEDLRLARAQAALEVARAERRLTEEEADAAVARDEWASLGEGEPTALVLREPQVAEAQAALAAARAQLSRAERDVERTEVRAPFAGRVREKMVDLGQFVVRGKTLARVYAVDYAEVRLPLPDADLAFVDLPLAYRGETGGTTGGNHGLARSSMSKLTVRPTVELSANFAGRRHTWPGEIVRTEGEIDPRTRMVVAVARVENPYGRGEPGRPPLSVGMFVDAAIRGRKLDGVFVLPREALRGADRVYVVDGEGRLRFRTVEVLRTDREHVVVREGLVAGEQIVVSPLEVVTDGTPVRLEPGSIHRPGESNRAEASVKAADQAEARGEERR